VLVQFAQMGETPPTGNGTEKAGGKRVHFGYPWGEIGEICVSLARLLTQFDLTGPERAGQPRGFSRMNDAVPGLPDFPVEGGCICGAVRYRLDAAPSGTYACHCKDCQRQSGGAFAISMIVARENFAVTAGETVTFDKRADSGRIVRQHACPTCHTRLFNEPLSSPGIIVLKPGTLDDSGWARPVGAIWTESRVPWAEIDWSLPNFPGQAPTREPLFAAWRAAHGITG
jgi:hypothetical protein